MARSVPTVRFAIAVFGSAVLAACAPAPAPVPAPAASVPAASAPVPRLADYLLIDKSDRTLTLFSGGAPIRRYGGLQFGDAPFGHKRFEGDERTPEGLYFIDARNPNSAYHLSLRVSYPDANDRARAAAFGRSPGGDIFLHGQPNALPAGRVPGDWTDGCVALTNAEIEEVWSLVPDGTPIMIEP